MSGYNPSAKKKQGAAVERVKVSVDCRPELISKVIGMQGANIKKIKHAMNEGTFIRGFQEGYFEISCKTMDGCNRAKKLLQNIIDDIASQKPSSIPCPRELVAHVIGSGFKLKTIQREVGSGCFIKGYDAHFEVSASTPEAVTKAESMLKKYIEDTKAEIASYGAGSGNGYAPAAAQVPGGAVVQATRGKRTRLDE